MGVTLSVVIELTQFYDVTRETAMSDVYANAAGTLLGTLAGASLKSDKTFVPFLTDVRRQPFVLLLIISWLAYRLCPFVPVIDLHKYWNALKPLWFEPQFSPLQLVRHTAAWLAIAALLEALVGNSRSRIALVLLLLGTLFGRVLIVGIVLSPGEVAGGFLAAVVWAAVLSRIRQRAAINALTFLTVVIVAGLSPFQFHTRSGSFDWIPFDGLMNAPIGGAMLSFFEKVFTYGTLVWLTTRAGCPWRTATAASAAILLAIEICQVYLPGRSCEITDPIILLIVSGIMSLMSEYPVPPVTAPQNSISL